MNDIRILIVEDDEDQCDLYRDAIGNHNEKEEVQNKLHADFKNDSASAIEQLQKSDYDAVFLDLQLQGDSEKLTTSGNEVLDYMVKNNVRTITYVISGTLATLNEKYTTAFKNPLLKTYAREKSSETIISDLIEVWQTGVTRILGKKGILDQKINDIFFHHLAKGFDIWRNSGKPCEKELLRYTTLHLLEFLDLPEDDEVQSSYFAPEFYIYPPIRKDLATGDIVNRDNKLHVLISPACDISPRGASTSKPEFNVETLVMLNLLDLDQSEFDSHEIRYNSKGKKDNQSWKKFVDNLKKGDKARFHFIPGYLEIPDSVIDFKKPSHLSLADYLDIKKTKRIATISTPFIRDIQSRFSAYYGRQGQPTGKWK